MFLVEKPTYSDRPWPDEISLGTEFAFAVHSAETRCTKRASKVVGSHTRPKQLFRLYRNNRYRAKLKYYYYYDYDYGKIGNGVMEIKPL